MEPIRIAIKAIKRLTGYFVIRPLQRYNIEERAFKKLERQSEEIKPAPKHRTTQELLEQIQREHPEILEDIKKEPEELLQRLTEVKVHSKGVDPDLKKGSKLPEVTRARPELETIVVSKGKVSMKSYCEILNSRHHNPFIYTPRYLSEKYDIDIEHVKDLLDHFRSFQVYSPSEIPKSRVPWWRPKDVNDFLFHGYAPYHYAQIDAEKQELEEGRRLAEETRQKQIERQKLQAAEWNAKQRRIADGGNNTTGIQSSLEIENGNLQPENVKISQKETRIQSGQSSLEIENGNLQPENVKTSQNKTGAINKK